MRESERGSASRPALSRCIRVSADEFAERYWGREPLLSTGAELGSAALRVLFTPVRVVCANTLSLAHRQGAGEGVSIMHKGDLEAKIRQAQQVLGLAQRFFDDAAAVIDRLSGYSPSSAQLTVYFRELYPDPEDSKNNGRAAKARSELQRLFEEGVGQKVRADLMDKCDLHTILRLPTGIFYAQGVKTNVLFFTRGEKDKGNTKAVWFFDMRTNAPSFGKRTPLTRAHFADFEKAYGTDPLGKSKRKDQGESGRFRKFTREDIQKRSDNLDITWLKDDSVAGHEDLPEPDVIAAEIIALAAEHRSERQPVLRVARVTHPDAPAPTSRALESAFYFTADDIVRQSRKLLGSRATRSVAAS